MNVYTEQILLSNSCDSSQEYFFFYLLFLIWLGHLFQKYITVSKKSN